MIVFSFVTKKFQLQFLLVSLKLVQKLSQSPWTPMIKCLVLQQSTACLKEQQQQQI